jgi:hypothetical protein
MLAAGAAQFLSGGGVALGSFAICCVYGLIATRTFYLQSWFWSGVKFLLVSFIYFVFCVCPAIAAALTLSFFNV